MRFCSACKATYGNEAATCDKAGCEAAAARTRLRELAGDGPEARYDRVERLGGGGPTEIWKARDRVTQTDVSYEIGDAGEGEGDGLSRLEGDLRQLLRARHPNLAAVTDWGRTADGRLFVVTEIRQGRTLEEALKDGPWPVEQAKAVVGQIGQAVLEVHKVGVIHRSLGPRSILVDAAGRAKLYDAAIGRVPVGAPSGGGHAAPEQAAGKPVDRRANIYNLAAVFYQIVTGYPPLDGVSPAALLDEGKRLSIRPPSARHPAGGLTKEIDATIMKALERLPSGRQPTLRAFLGEVEALPIALAAPKAAPAVPTPAVTPRPSEAARAAVVASPSSQREPTPTRSMTVAGFAPLTKLSQADLAKRIRDLPMPAEVPNAPARLPAAVERKPTTTGERKLPRVDSPTAAPTAPTRAANAGSLRRSDIAQLLQSAKAQPAAPAAASDPLAAPPTSEPALEVPAPALPATLKKSDIAQLLGVAKARQSSVMPAVAVAEPTPEIEAAPDPHDEASLAQKKQLIAQMLRERKTNPAMPASPARPAEPAASPPPNEPAAAATEPKAAPEKPQAAVPNAATADAGTAGDDPMEAAFGSSRRQQRRRAGAIVAVIGLAVAAKLGISSMAGPSHASGGALTARPSQSAAEAIVLEAPPAPPIGDASPSGAVLTRARPPASPPPSLAARAVSMTSGTKQAQSSGASSDVWKGIMAKKGGKTFGEVLRQDEGLDPANLLPQSPPLLGPKSQPIEAPTPTLPKPR